MKAHRPARVRVGLLVIALLGLAPVAPARVAAADAHWIAVRTVPTGGTELYDTRTGLRFVPRGVNLLHDVAQPGGGQSDLIVAPGAYDPAWVDQQLTHVARLGFNTIRVFLDLCPFDCLTLPDPAPRPAWLDNIAALLQAAKDHGLVVLLTSNELPEAYVAQLPCCSSFHPGFNGQILSAEGINWYHVYWRQILVGLQERAAPLEVVLAWELRNELFVDGHLDPLSWRTGLVTAANGVTYDMSDPAAKVDMVDDGFLYWSDRLRETIRAIDPTALVTVGFFPPDAPHSVRPGDTRVVQTARFLRESSVDFFDLHAYPNLDLQLSQIVENFTLDATVTKPLVMGEMGSIVPAHPDGAAAGSALAGWADASCDFGFDGWLAWVWGSLDSSVLKLEQDGFAMATGVSPLAVPDPCNSGAPPNLAHLRPVTASSELPGLEAARVADGLALTAWNSGDGPPAEIVIDLGSPMTIHEVRLLTAQDPPGATTHRIEARRQTGGWMLLEKLSGVTTGEQWLRVFPSPPVQNIRWIRVKTQKSPSWISWWEIQVY